MTERMVTLPINATKYTKQNGIENQEWTYSNPGNPLRINMGSIVLLLLQTTMVTFGKQEECFLVFPSKLSRVNMSSAIRIQCIFPPNSQRQEGCTSKGSYMRISSQQSTKFQSKKCVPYNLVISDKKSDEFALRTLKIKAVEEQIKKFLSNIIIIKLEKRQSKCL